ncbi:hypothetical protein BH160DRAFT_0394 [Burkholderia sp. H160]|nr:hypothetical protein BH160DRAFT_0394 [Burkholderia sp. H160]
MSADAARSAALKSLRQKFAAIDAALAGVDGAADPAKVYAQVAALKEDVLRDAAQLHALEIHRRLLNRKARLTTADRAALLVARQLLSLPDDPVDQKRWRVSFPVPVPKEQVLTDAQQRAMQICTAVCRRVAAKEKPKAALPAVAVEFNVSYATARDAYYRYRDEIAPLVKVERGESV